MSFLSRFEPLVGLENLNKIKQARVAVFGLGGVGSYTVEALARSGIGELIIIDGDIIEKSNINRQLYALHSTLGKYKTELAKLRIFDINPLCKVTDLNAFILPDTFYEILGKDFFKNIDFIVDAVDTVSLKIFLALECEKNNVSLISAMGCGNRLNADFEFADIYKTSGCPLCRIMRTELKKRKVKSLKVLYSKSQCTVKKIPPSSASWVPSIAGLLIAGEVIKKMLF